jgi:hypothetical protein
MPLPDVVGRSGETMRGSWPQLAAGTLALAVIGGLLLLPGHLVKPAEVAAPLVLPHFAAPAPVEAVPAPIAAPRKHRVVHRPSVAVHVAPAPAATAQLASVVVPPPAHVTRRPVARPAAAARAPKRAVGHPYRPHLLPPEPAAPAPTPPPAPTPTPTPTPASPAAPPPEAPSAGEPTRVLADARAPSLAVPDVGEGDDRGHGRGRGNDQGHGHEGGGGPGHGHGGPGHGK